MHQMILKLNLTLFWLILSSVSSADTLKESVWDLLKQPNHLALLRHALAPGTGDPQNFRVDDCSTQRNLSDVGRRQAKAIGTAFRKNGMADANVYSSQWCRCLETARLMALGPVNEKPFLNSFFSDFSQKRNHINGAKSWLAESFVDKATKEMVNTRHNTKHIPTVFVTHQVTITGLTGIFPGSGEMIVARVEANGELEVVGRLAFPTR